MKTAEILELLKGEINGGAFINIDFQIDNVKDTRMLKKYMEFANVRNNRTYKKITADTEFVFYKVVYISTIKNILELFCKDINMGVFEGKRIYKIVPDGIWKIDFIIKSLNDAIECEHGLVTYKIADNKYMTTIDLLAICGDKGIFLHDIMNVPYIITTEWYKNNLWKYYVMDFNLIQDFSSIVVTASHQITKELLEKIRAPIGYSLIGSFVDFPDNITIKGLIKIAYETGSSRVIKNIMNCNLDEKDKFITIEAILGKQ